MSRSIFPGVPFVKPPPRIRKGFVLVLLAMLASFSILCLTGYVWLRHRYRPNPDIFISPGTTMQEIEDAFGPPDYVSLRLQHFDYPTHPVYHPITPQCSRAPKALVYSRRRQPMDFLAPDRPVDDRKIVIFVDSSHNVVCVEQR